MRSRILDEYICVIYVIYALEIKVELKVHFEVWVRKVLERKNMKPVLKPEWVEKTFTLRGTSASTGGLSLFSAGSRKKEQD